MKIFTLVLFFAFAANAQTIGLTTVASGLSQPVHITHAGDARLFVVQQGGAIRIVNAGGTINSTNFLTLGTSLISTGGERGLLGLAFHPDYATNGYFYVNYTRSGDGATVIARYSVSANPDIANATSGTILLTIAQPFANHNGGTIKFGPDGFLYIGMGDGGSGGDPGNRAQNINENLGKMLRIDVNSGSPYGIPAGNPYVGIAGNDEIWAIGLRNPWKFSFDRANGDLWIADVGQNEMEEINRVSGSLSGANYGWKCYEGTEVYSSCTTPATYTFPIAEYSHSETSGCSITGGYVYRGTTYPNFVGKYFFADYCRNRIAYVDNSDAIIWSPEFAGSNNFTTFGENLAGELFVTGGSTIYRVVDTSLNTNEVSKNMFSLYPNPASTEVYIKSASGTILTKAYIYDLAGKQLLTEQLSDPEVNSININSLQSGMYLVTVEDNIGGKFSTKLTVK